MSPAAAFKIDVFVAAALSGTIAGVLRDSAAMVLCVVAAPVVVWLIDVTMTGFKHNRRRLERPATLAGRGARPR